MQQDWVDYVIPFHFSGLEKKYYETLGWQDFTSTQMEQLVYRDKTPKGVAPSEVRDLSTRTPGEASREYARLCFQRKAYPIKVEEIFSGIANDESLNAAQKRTAARERWKNMVDSGQFDENKIDSGYFQKRLQAGKTTKDKPIYPRDVPRVRMHEVKNKETGHSTIQGMNDVEGTRTYLELCLERKIYPVFPNFCFKESVFADLNAEFEAKKAGKTKEELAKLEVERRKTEVARAKAMWKEMVDAGKIDWDKIDGNAFKFKKDYARTDTPFEVVQPDKIDMEAAREPLQETLEKGLDEKYKADPQIAEDLVKLARYGEKTGKSIGVASLEAARRERDVLSSIMGGEERPTNYSRPKTTELYEGDSAGPRGKISLLDNGQRIIQLFKGSDLSTIAHESWHSFFESMQSLVESGNASEQLQKDWKTMLDWVGAENGQALTVEQKELLARGGEAYLTEGKAPSTKVEGLMHRFASWLASIYRDIQGYLGAEITDEVRGVFDRILAAEDQVDQALKDLHLDRPSSAELDRLGITGRRRAKILSDAKALAEEAAAKLYKARQAGAREREARLRKDAVEQLKTERPFVARSKMRATPLDLDYVKEVFGDEYARRLQKKMPGLFREGGAEPESFARDNGYTDAKEMLGELLATPTKKERINQLIKEGMAAHDEEFSADEIMLETDALGQMREEYGKAIEALIAPDAYAAEVHGPDSRRALTQNEIRNIAREYARKTQVSRLLNADYYRRQVAKWMQEERKAILKKDYAAALEANHKSRLNIELARISAATLDQVQKVSRAVKRFTRSERPDPDARYIVYYLGTRYGLLNPSQAMENISSVRDMSTVAAWYDKIHAEGYTLTYDPNVFSQEKAFRELTGEELQAVVGEIMPVIAIERDMRMIDTLQGRFELEKLTGEISDSIYAMNPKRDLRTVSTDSRLKSFLEQFHVDHLKADTIARLMDGDKLGIVWQHVIRPINVATWDEAMRFKEVQAQLKKIFSVYDRKELLRMRHEKVFVDSIGESMTREQMLCVLLNWGNESNAKRVMDGHGWSEDQVADILNRLDKKDYDFAQSVWDYVETFRKESFDQEEKLTGVRPTAIEGRPLQTKYGEYRGGYYPAAYNPEFSQRAGELTDLTQAVGGVVPAVEHGSMKERSTSGNGPMQLSLNVLTDHLSKTVHNLAFRQPVRNVQKILRNRAVQKAMQETAGIKQVKALMEWLTDVAQQHPAKESPDKVLTWARTSMSMYTMGFKATTMVVQATGYLASISEIGPRWMGVGLAHVFGKRLPGKGWVDLYKETAALSPMMANRLENFDREAKDWSRQKMEDGSLNPVLDPLKRASTWAKKHAFKPMAIIQMGVDLPTWWGAYYRKVSEGGTQKEAVEYADNVVEVAQVGGNQKDLAKLQRSTGFARFLTMYYSYFSALYNIFTRRATMAARDPSAHNIRRLATAGLFFWILEPVLSELLAGRGPDDDDDWLQWLASKTLTAPFNMVVGVRDIASGIDGLANGTSRGYRMSPVVSVFEEPTRLAANMIKVGMGDKDLDANVVKQAAKTVGMLSGTPLLGSQVQTTLGNLWDWLDGTSEMELRDILFTKPKDRR